MQGRSKSNVTQIRALQEERLDRRMDQIVGELKVQHVKIEDMVSRLMTCLATVQIVEQSVGAASSLGTAAAMRRSLDDAQVVLKDISRQLGGMGVRLS